MGLRKLTSDQVVHLMHVGEHHLGLLPRGEQGLLVSVGGNLQLPNSFVALLLKRLLHCHPSLQQLIQLGLVRRPQA